MSTSWWHEQIQIGNAEITPANFIRENWTTLTDQDIYNLLQDAGVDVSVAAVTKMRQHLGLRKTRHGVPIIFEDGGAPLYNKPPVIKSDNVLVMADVHAPYHDIDWCSEVLYIAQSFNIKDCIIAGDLLDFASLSTFARFIKTKKQTDDDYEDFTGEIESAAGFVDVLLGAFDNIVYTLGNHEKRLSRAASVRVRTELIGALLGKTLEKRLKIEPYYYSVIKSKTGRWRVTHPKNTSVIPLRVASRLADKYGMHIIAAHGHDWGCTTSVSGLYAAACGACCDIDRMDYVQLEDNLRPIMQNGAWMLVDGKPFLLHPKYGTEENIQLPN